MNEFETYSGKLVDLENPDPEEITITDIAHHLSQINRFNGATRFPYSVAQHCVLMSRAVPPEHALWALLHDAAEAYVGDLYSHLKNSPGFAAYREIEKRLLSVIKSKFLLVDNWAPGQWAATATHIKVADLRMLLTERDQLRDKHRPGFQWAPDLEALERYKVEIVPWSAPLAKDSYLVAYNMLRKC